MLPLVKQGLKLRESIRENIAQNETTEMDESTVAGNRMKRGQPTNLDTRGWHDQFDCAASFGMIVLWISERLLSTRRASVANEVDAEALSP